MTFDTTTIAVAAVAFLLLAKLALARRAPAAVVSQKIAAGATVLDVRSPGEFAGGAYRGALNIPVQELAGRLGRVPKDRPVVVYCASGARSAVAVRILKKAGYGDVVNAGGLHHLS